MENIKTKFIIIGVGIIIGLILLWIFNPFVVVGAGQRGVVLNFGAVQKTVLEEGIHLRIPIVQSIVKIDVRVHKSQVGADSVSKDLQDTKSIVAVNYHLLPSKANWVYQRIGTSYKERIIDPAVQESVKAATARYTAVELITQRDKVRTDIRNILSQRLNPYSIIVDDFAIVNFEFSKQFTQAIESKQTAEQLALKAQRDLERIKIEADQKIASAKAEAESLRLQKENVTPQLLQLRKIEASIRAIEKWNGKLPTITGGVMPFLDVTNTDILK